jgi:hypothetical protein
MTKAWGRPAQAIAGYFTASGLPRADPIGAVVAVVVASKRQSSAHAGAQAAPSFEECLKLCLNYAPLDKDDRALLECWLKDERANEVWSAIRTHSELHDGPIGVDAGIYFIDFILTAKEAAERESEINVELAAITAERKRLLSQIRTRIAQSVRTQVGKLARARVAVPDNKLAEFLESAGKYVRGLHPLVISQPRVRSDRNGSRARPISCEMFRT